MKGIDIFCASQASTAICMSMDEGSTSSSTIRLGGRAIDRHNPIIRDVRRTTKTLTGGAPCSSQPPISPKPLHQHQKSRKSSSSSKPSDSSKKNSEKQSDQKRKSCAKPTDDSIKKSCAKPGDLISPPESSRYLLSDAVFFDGLSDVDPVLALAPVEPKKTSHEAVKTDESAAEPAASKPLSSSGSSDQVVVLRVSLHCKGCEGKVRKHIARMEGVTSFNIDFAAKKVTVIGNVTPLGVLESVSKVKSAQLWTPAAQSSLQPPSAGSSTKMETKKFKE
ncbi:hypothetical protein L1049_008632 [Liquidambar formosana]|uniref:HMA domain-containing protein n=1 Tax=Liquidambar formosana TaxID=63359 RepID=A0AAP0S9Q0_LIQFO